MKIRLAAALTAALLLLGGCSLPQTAEISDRLIIEAIGIDLTDDGDTAVTVQYLDSISPGNGENAYNSTGLTELCRSVGRTVGEALNRLPALTGLEPLYSQTRLIVLGRKAAESGTRALLDFFLREYTVRPDVFVAAAENTAREIVSADFGPNIIGAAALEDILTSGCKTGQTSAVPLYKFIAAVSSPDGCAGCQLLGVRESTEVEGEQTVFPAGTVLFRGDRAKAVIAPEETPVFLMLCGKLEKADLSFSHGGSRMTVSILRCRTRTKTDTDEKGLPRFRTECALTADLTEFTAADGGSLRGTDAKKAADALAAELTERAAGLLRDYYFGEGCDFCRYNALFRLRHPVYYRALYESGIKKTPPASAMLTFSVSIRRTGREIPIK